MDNHYVCPACGGESNVSKSCSTEGCRLSGEQLKACTCSNHKHSGVVEEATQT